MVLRPFLCLIVCLAFGFSSSAQDSSAYEEYTPLPVSYIVRVGSGFNAPVNNSSVVNAENSLTYNAEIGFAYEIGKTGKFMVSGGYGQLPIRTKLSESEKSLLAFSIPYGFLGFEYQFLMPKNFKFTIGGEAQINSQSFFRDSVQMNSGDYLIAERRSNESAGVQVAFRFSLMKSFSLGDKSSIEMGAFGKVINSSKSIVAYNSSASAANSIEGDVISSGSFIGLGLAYCFSPKSK